MMYTVVGDARANNSNFEHKFDSSQSQSFEVSIVEYTTLLIDMEL